MKFAARRGFTALALVVSFSSVALAQDLTTPQQKAGCSVGANMGGALAGQGLQQDLDMNALLQGIQDAMSGGDMKMTMEDMQASLEQLSAQVQARAQAEMEQQSQAAKEFLTKNATAPGVKTTASGLQYLVVTEGSDASAAKPKETDTVRVHYHGTLTDGTVFDSSVERNEPISFPLNGVIPGWTEGLQLMKVGDKYRFFIPSELGYGENGAGPIPPNSTLIFDVELLAIEAPAGNAAP